MALIIIGKPGSISSFICKACLLISLVIGVSFFTIIVLCLCMTSHVIMGINHLITVLFCGNSSHLFIIILISHNSFIRKALLCSTVLTVILICDCYYSLRINYLFNPVFTIVCKLSCSTIYFCNAYKSFIFIGIRNRPTCLVGHFFYKSFIFIL